MCVFGGGGSTFVNSTGINMLKKIIKKKASEPDSIDMVIIWVRDVPMGTA